MKNKKENLIGDALVGVTIIIFITLLLLAIW